MAKSWKKLQDQVRDIASLHWAAPSQAEHLHGVDFDIVLRPSSDEVILIEVTEEHNLEKIRKDLNKLAPVRMNLLVSGVNCKAFIVLRDTPTESMVEAGRTQHIGIHSLPQFERLFFDYSGYKYLRNQLPFGSAIDPETGERDKKAYIPVHYLEPVTNQKFDTRSIAEQLTRGERIVLLGDFGTGKSRCVQETFKTLSDSVAECGAYTLAVNLREHWGAKKASEILAGHVEALGLGQSIDNIRRLLNSGHLILLLDGLDEVGAQTFGIKREDVAQMRRNALEGIRHLIRESKHGVLVTGRSHYFDSDEEMMDALGLSNQARLVRILNCADEFTAQEGKQYLTQLGITAEPPTWLPRKPLIFQILGSIDHKTAAVMLQDDLGEFEFWGIFLNQVCEREARIHSSLDAQSVRLLLREIAHTTRQQDSFLGTIGTKDINRAYESVSGDSPDESAQQMLLRLCTLGRIGSASTDRQFVDPVIVDVLRAESLLAQIRGKNPTYMSERWKQPLRMHGMFLIIDAIIVHSEQGLLISTIHSNSDQENKQALAEMAASLLLLDDEPHDFKGIRLSDCEIYYLDFSGKDITHLSVENCVISNLKINETKISSGSKTTVSNCLIEELLGVANAAALPTWIQNCSVEQFDNVSTANRIRGTNLSPAHLLLVSVIHRIFFQPGAGRKESALLKGGYGQTFDNKMVERVLRLLMNEGAVARHKGDEGWIYRPVRSATARMNAIKTQLTLSKDPLWVEVGKLN